MGKKAGTKETNVVVQTKMFDDLFNMMEALTGFRPTSKAQLARRGLSMLKQDLMERVEANPNLELEDVLEGDQLEDSNQGPDLPVQCVGCGDKAEFRNDDGEPACIECK